MNVRRAVAVVGVLALLAISCGSNGTNQEPGLAQESTTAPTTTAPAEVPTSSPPTQPQPTLRALPDPLPVAYPVSPTSGAPDMFSYLLPWQEGFIGIFSIPQSTPFPELTEEQMALFPEEVLDVFEGAPPATLEEATARVIEADVTDEVSSVFEAHPELAELIQGNRTPDRLEAWTSLDGLEWEPAGEVPVPAGSAVWNVRSDGERLLLEAGEEVAATEDLSNWVPLPAPIELQSDAKGVTQSETYVAALDHNADGWVVATRGFVEGPDGTDDTVLSLLTTAGWGETPIEHDLGPRFATSVALTEAGPLAMTTSEDSSQGPALYLAGEELIEVALPEGVEYGAVFPVAGGVLLATEDAVHRAPLDTWAWTRIQLPGADLAVWNTWISAPPVISTSPYTLELDVGPDHSLIATVDGWEWFVARLDDQSFGDGEGGAAAMNGETFLVTTPDGLLAYELD